MDNVTSIEPQSVAADKEQEADPDVSTYRVLRRDLMDDLIWHELTWLTWLTSRYVPTAGDVGEAYGEGEYLLIEKDGRYSFMSTYEMRVVAEKRYRLADDEQA